MSRRRPCGWTIAETLVAGAVFTVIMSAMVQLFVMSIRASQSGQDQVELQQHAVIFLHRWDRDMARTAGYAMQGFHGGRYSVVSMGITSGPGGDGRLLWRDDRFVVYVFDQEERTVSRFLFDNSTQPFQNKLTELRPYLPSPSELQTAATNGASTAYQARTVLQNVEEFHFADGKGLQTQFLNPALHLRFQLRKDPENERPFANFTVERRYALRNHFR